jgi:hypothetical protein
MKRRKRDSPKRRHPKGIRRLKHTTPRLPSPIRSSIARRQEARARGLAAVNDVRKGKYETLSAAARARETTVEFIKRELPGTLLPSRPGKRMRVRASDRYPQLVEILTESGPVVVTARGSRERDLAGQHRAAYLSVLRGQQSGSVLKRFRGKKVGGRGLLSSYERLLKLGRGGVADDLAALYVPPDSNA